MKLSSPRQQPGPEIPNNHEHHSLIIYQLIIIIALGLFVAPRFIHLDADPHPDYIPGDTGYRIDEGFKTFAPKNLMIFGATRWHSSDHYIGWMKQSPATQWPYYYAFRNMGLELKNARMVTAVYSVLFLIIALYFLTRRYGLPLAAAGVMLLTSEAALFYFSRSALFEISVILFSYTGILFTTRINNDNPLKAAMVMLVFMFIATYAVKRSAMIYCIPPIIAYSLFALFGKNHRSRRNAAFVTLAGLAIVPLLYLTRKSWIPRVSSIPDTILYLPKEFLFAPMPELSPLAFLIGYSCILHLMVVKPGSLFNNIYRLSLTAIIIGGPLILSLLFHYNPPRYYLPIVPACLLIAIEWFNLKAWKLDLVDRFTITQGLAIVAVFVAFSMLLLRTFEILVLENLPFSIGEEPGLSTPTLLRLFPLFLAGLYGFYYIARTVAIRLLGFSIPLMVLTSTIMGFTAQTIAITNASFDSQVIRSELNTIVGATESIAGSFAPFFTAESPIPAFYMTLWTNTPTPEHIERIHPDYFLFSAPAFDQPSLDALESNDLVQLGPPRHIGTYWGHDVSLYRINYKKE